MLSEKDLKKIREVIREELTIKDVEVQRVGSDGVIEKKIIDLYLPTWLAAEVPNMAAALRGVQETADNAKNNSWKLLRGMDGALTKFYEQIIKHIENKLIDDAFVDKIIKRLKYNEAEILEIESSS